MVGDLPHTNFVHNEYVDKITNENESNKIAQSSEGLPKILDNEASESVF